MIAVEKGVPIPPKQNGRPSKYPFESMAVGDSFAVPVPAQKEPRSVAQSLTNTAAAWVKRSGSAVKFTVRVVQEDGKTVVRVWAVAK